LKPLVNEPGAICYRAARLAKINLSGADQQVLNEFARHLGPKLVLYAIEVAKQETRYNYPSWGFLRSILRRYETQGIKTVEEAQNNASSPSKRDKKASIKQRQPIKEPMPEWSKKSPDELYKKASPAEVQALKARIANRHKKKASG
ncbi:DnaD domain-containing protein, partial [Limosilactobacillus reuteri]